MEWSVLAKKNWMDGMAALSHYLACINKFNRIMGRHDPVESTMN
jgi:hypothetical protein